MHEQSRSSKFAWHNHLISRVQKHRCRHRNNLEIVAIPSPFLFTEALLFFLLLLLLLLLLFSSCRLSSLTGLLGGFAFALDAAVTTPGNENQVYRQKYDKSNTESAQDCEDDLPLCGTEVVAAAAGGRDCSGAHGCVRGGGGVPACCTTTAFGEC